MGNSLQALEDQYTLLMQQLSDTLDACQNQQQRDAVNTQYVTSRRNYWNSIGKIFHDDDPTIISLVAQMKTEQLNIKDTMNHLNQIAQVINIITDAVSVGSSLAAKVG